MPHPSRIRLDADVKNSIPAFVDQHFKPSPNPPAISLLHWKRQMQRLPRSRALRLHPVAPQPAGHGRTNHNSTNSSDSNMPPNVVNDGSVGKLSTKGRSGISIFQGGLDSEGMANSAYPPSDVQQSRLGIRGHARQSQS